LAAFSKETEQWSVVCRSSADQHKEAMNHFVAGKRHLLVKDISAAVTSLGQVGPAGILSMSWMLSLKNRVQHPYLSVLRIRIILTYLDLDPDWIRIRIGSGSDHIFFAGRNSRAGKFFS